jgi:hypothetical protein
MSRYRLYLLFWCAAAGVLAYICFDYWSARHAPLYTRLERQWTADVKTLEASGKLPRVWFDVKDIKVIGGTPETKQWLRRIKIPLKPNPKGHHHMEILVVAWEESGKRGALVQYNIEDGKTTNTLLELGRTFILEGPRQ